MPFTVKKHDNPILQITNIVFKNEVYCEHFLPEKKTLFTITNEVNVSFHGLKSLRVHCSRNQQTHFYVPVRVPVLIVFVNLIGTMQLRLSRLIGTGPDPDNQISK